VVDISEFARIADANTLSIGPDGTKGSHADDEIVVVLEDVTNPSPGSNDVNITTNPQSVNSQATTRYTVESDLTPSPQRTSAGEIVVTREEGKTGHTVYVRPGEATAGSLRTLTIEYEQATLSQLDRASVTVGVDRGADAAGTTINEPLTARWPPSRSSESESQLTLQVNGSASVGVRDELVVVYSDVALSENTQRVVAQLNPGTLVGV